MTFEQIKPGGTPLVVLGGKTSLEKVCELLPQTPLSDEVFAQYNPVNEPFQERGLQG